MRPITSTPRVKVVWVGRLVVVPLLSLLCLQWALLLSSPLVGSSVSSRQQREHDDDDPMKHTTATRNNHNHKDHPPFSPHHDWILASSSTVDTPASSPSPNKNNDPELDTPDQDKDTTEAPQQQQHPQIAWLLSFPNSGTSYTMMNTQHVTGYRTATNYARDWNWTTADTNNPNTSSIVAWTPEGPFSKAPTTTTTIPHSFVLTKTHCTGYCTACPPQAYVIPTVDDFVHGCHQTELPVTSTATTTKTTTRSGHYSPDTMPVARAIHLIRHPLDNLVSRLHLALKPHLIVRKPELHAILMNNDTVSTERQRLEAWCDWVDARHQAKLQQALQLWLRQDAENEAPHHPPAAWPFVTNHEHHNSSSESLLLWETDPHYVLRLLLGQHPVTQNNVLCRTELFRYVQWHARAWQMTQALQIPVHMVHYESYSTNFTATVQGIVHFLHQSDDDTTFRKSSSLPFIAGKSYVDTLFTPAEQVAMGRYIQTLANPTSPVWSLMQHYFATILD